MKIMNIHKERLLRLCLAMTFIIGDCLFAAIVFASEKSAPDKGIQGQVWIEAEGEAYLGEIETQKEVKERAKRDAQNKAVEQAVGAFVKAHTLVSNYQIAEDLIYTA